MTVTRLEAPPGLGRLYLAALTGARGSRAGELPATVYELAGVRAGGERLAAYDALCGFRLTDRLPPTFPHLLAFPLAMKLMTDPGFPFPLPGLVHVANRITQSRSLLLGEELLLRVSARDLRRHDRGRQLDVVGEALVDGAAVWTDVSTYLHIEGAPGARGHHAATEPPADPSARWRVDAGTGRRYAAVSGDSNPIHLHPLAARLFGFPRAIAHGMWLKARCLAALEGRLPDALEAAVEFRSPLLLPATVAFSSHRDGDGWRFSVVDARSGRPHLEGSAVPAGNRASPSGG